MPENTVNMTFKVALVDAIDASLRVRPFTRSLPSGGKWQNIDLDEDSLEAEVELMAASTYDLQYAFMGEPLGKITITVTDGEGKKLLERKDSIGKNDLSREDQCALVIP